MDVIMAVGCLFVFFLLQPRNGWGGCFFLWFVFLAGRKDKGKKKEQGEWKEKERHGAGKP
jgi:hypothetical protein